MADDTIEKLENMDVSNIETPSEIVVTRFAAARAKEISALTELIENPKTTKLIFQKLPCHMRRRAMSHNPKRMPVYLRAAHISQMEKSGTSKVSKRPRRKYRRRPSNLLEEYQRRFRANVWLETHIWHAKRFRMIKKWGYKIASQSYERSFRFCYRAAAKHTLLMDISYMCCIEISGEESTILDGLDQLCSTKTGLTFRSVSSLNGNQEGRLMLYQRNGFPHQPIGYVTFMWRYGDNSSHRSLWIWTHPSFHQQVVDELQHIFQLDSDLMNKQSGVQVVLNKDKLNRFRLRGPLSYPVVCGLVGGRGVPDYLLSGSLPPGFIAAVQVRDPRITLPFIRSKASGPAPPKAPGLTVDQEISRSPLWDAKLRDEISQIRKAVPDYKINQFKNEKVMIPGMPVPVMDHERDIPFIVVNASNEGNVYVPGCDLILPSGWATAFWISLIYNGGHAGSLFDAHRLHYEYGICRDLHLEIDSDAGQMDTEQHRKDLMDSFFKKPPKTRTNHIKLGTPFPFGIDWNRLITDWTDQPLEGSPYVCRNRSLLRSLSIPLPRSLDATLLNGSCLVEVKVTTSNGFPSEFAIICLPAEGDNPSKALEEPIRKDPGSKERKQLRTQHKSDLKELAKKRKDHADQNTEAYSSATICSVYKEKMRRLWIPDPANLKTSYFRPIVGFVMQGDYALSLGKGVGRGFVLGRTLPLLRNSSVLVRNPGTKHFMWAELSLA